MSQKDRKTFRALSYFEHFIVFVSAVSDYVSSSAHGSLVGIFVGIASSAVGLQIFVLSAGFKKYKSVNKKKRKNHDKIVLLTKIKLNTVEVLI